MADDIIITNTVTIPGSELTITASRSSGPGGQHANKADTRIQVRWNLEASEALTEVQKNRLRRALRTRLTDEGDVLIACETHRSQKRNRDEALQRLAAIVREGLVPPKPRRKTKPSRASKERRLAEKRKRAQVKKGRQGQED